MELQFFVSYGELPRPPPRPTLPARTLLPLRVPWLGRPVLPSPIAGSLSVPMSGAGASSAAAATGSDIFVVEPDGRYYCRPCDMRLNGPTQWEEHRRGKKHAKKMSTYQLSGDSVPPPAHDPDGDLPAVFRFQSSSGHTIEIRRDALGDMYGGVLTNSQWSDCLDLMSWCCRTRPYSPSIATDIMTEVSGLLRDMDAQAVTTGADV